MALIRVKYIDPDDSGFGLDQDVPKYLVELTDKKMEEGLQEAVLHWPRKGGSGKGKGKKAKSKSPKRYRVALLDAPPTASKIPTSHGRGRYDKPGM